MNTRVITSTQRKRNTTLPLFMLISIFFLLFWAAADGYRPGVSARFLTVCLVFAVSLCSCDFVVFGFCCVFVFLCFSLWSGSRPHSPFLPIRLPILVSHTSFLPIPPFPVHTPIFLPTRADRGLGENREKERSKVRGVGG